MSSRVTCFRYSEAVIIAVVYPNFVLSGNAVCVVLMEAAILANSFIVFYIGVLVGHPITLVMVFDRSSLMVLS